MFHFTFSVIDVAKYGKNSVKILEYIFRHGRVHISDLKNVVADYITYSRTVSLLEKDGIVSIELMSWWFPLVVSHSLLGREN